MKRMMMALAVSLMMTTAVMAQDNQSNGKIGKMRMMDPTEMIQKRTDATVKKYGLDETQAKKLLELNTKYASKMGPRMGRPGGRRPDANNARPELTDEQKAQMKERRQKMEEQMNAYNTELQGILTADQYKSYQADQQKQRMVRPAKAKTEEKE